MHVQTYRSLQLQYRRLSWLVLKYAPGFGAVLPGVYFLVRGLPLVPAGMHGNGVIQEGRWRVAMATQQGQGLTEHHIRAAYVLQKYDNQQDYDGKNIQLNNTLLR